MLSQLLNKTDILIIIKTKLHCRAQALPGGNIRESEAKMSKSPYRCSRPDSRCGSWWQWRHPPTRSPSWRVKAVCWGPESWNHPTRFSWVHHSGTSDSELALFVLPGVGVSLWAGNPAVLSCRLVLVSTDPHLICKQGTWVWLSVAWASSIDSASKTDDRTKWQQGPSPSRCTRNTWKCQMLQFSFPFLHKPGRVLC